MTSSLPASPTTTSPTKDAMAKVGQSEGGDPWIISIKAVGSDIDLEGGGDMNSSGERQFTVHVSPEDHLESLHDQIEASTGLKASQQRLIYRGRLIGIHADAAAAASVVTPSPEKSTDPDDLTLKTEQPSPSLKIKDIEGLADGQTIHLLRRREALDDSAVNNGRPSSTTGSVRPRSSTIPNDGTTTTTTTTEGGGGGATSDAVSTGGLLATLLGLSNLTDDNDDNATRRGSRSRPGRSSRRTHYRMTAEDRRVPDPGSMEPVRQGLMTLHTLLPHLRTDDSDTPLESNRRWYRGQWLDCLDTVNAWLEATVVEIMAPEDILPQAYDGGVSLLTPSHRRLPQVHNDPAVSATDLEGRRRLLLEACEPGDDRQIGGELSGFRPRSSNRGIQLLLIHYNGWPHRWDEWIRSDSPRLRPFRTRTRHPNVSSTASPTPQSIFHESPRTNILPRGDDSLDRTALVPELARVMGLVNEVVQRQAAVAADDALDASLDPRFSSVRSNVPDAPWISALSRQDNPSLEEDSRRRRGNEPEMSGLMRYARSADSEESGPNFEDQNNDDDSTRPLGERREGDGSSYDEDRLFVATMEQQRLLIEHNARYSRRELHNLATLIDRLGRTLTDAAPHIASLADNRPPDDIPDDALMGDDAVDHVLEEIAASIRRDAESTANDTPIGGLLSLWSRERRNSNGPLLLDSRRREQPQEARPPAPTRPVVDPDHEDFVSGLVNTTRGEVRTGPRSRSSNDEVANLLGAYLAAATLGNGSTGDGGHDDGNTGLGQLLRGGAGGGGGIDIHIHAVVTGPGGTFGTGTGINTTILGGGTAVGGPRNLFSTNRRNSPASSVIRNGSSPGSYLGTRRRIAASDDDDRGIFDELYSETPAPIDPSTPPGTSIDHTTPPQLNYSVSGNSRAAMELHDPDASEGTSNGDYITGLNTTSREGSENLFGTVYRRQYAPTDLYIPGGNRPIGSLNYGSVGATTLAGRGGISSTTRRRAYRGSSFSGPQENRTEIELPRRRLSSIGRLFRRRSSRANPDEPRNPRP